MSAKKKQPPKKKSTKKPSISSKKPRKTTVKMKPVSKDELLHWNWNCDCGSLLCKGYEVGGYVKPGPSMPEPGKRGVFMKIREFFSL